MTWTWVCKILCDPFAPSRFTKDEVLSLTWSYVSEVLFCERDDDRNPKLPGGPKVSKDDQLRDFWKKRGLPAHLVEEKVRESRGRRRTETKTRS